MADLRYLVVFTTQTGELICVNPGQVTSLGVQVFNVPIPDPLGGRPSNRAMAGTRLNLSDGQIHVLAMPIDDVKKKLEAVNMPQYTTEEVIRGIYDVLTRLEASISPKAQFQGKPFPREDRCSNSKG